MTVRALLFDLDDTLVPEEPAIVAGYEAVAERVWGAATPERVRQLRDAAHAVWLAGVPREYKERVHFSLAEGLHGELTAVGPDPDRMRAFIPRLHAEAFEAVLPPERRGTSPDLVRVWREARMAALAPYPETHEVLRALRGRFALGIVTNGAERLQRAKLERTGLDGCFDVVVVSEMVGVGKPSPKPFEVALRELGVGADEAAMVGNDSSRDIAGARAAGIRPVWLYRPADRWGHGDPGDAERIDDLRGLLRLPGVAQHVAPVT